MGSYFPSRQFNAFQYSKGQESALRGSSINISWTDNCCCFWFKNHLVDRSYYVTFKDAISDISLVLPGVPQESILRPLLFVIYSVYHALL